MARLVVVVSALAMCCVATDAAAAPRPLLSVDAWPLRARVELRDASGRVMRGRAFFRRRVARGPVRVTVRLAGHRTWTRSVDVRAATHLTACLDPDDQLVRCRHILRTGWVPKSVALSADGREAWVALLGTRPGLEVFDVVAGKRAAVVTLGRGATEVRFSRDAKQSFVFASQMESGRVYEVDRRGRRVLRRFASGGVLTKMMELSRDGFTLYASNWRSDTVSEIDLVSGRVRRRLHTGHTPRGMVLGPDGRSLYVATFGSGTVEKIDLASARRRVIYHGTSMRHIVADRARRRLYASDLDGDAIVVVDTATDRARVLAHTDHTPNTIALGPRGRVLFVSCRGRDNPASYLRRGPEWGSVLLLDARDGRVLDAIVAGNQTTGLAISGDGRTLAFSDFLDGRLRVYDVPSYRALRAGRGGRAVSHLRDLRKDAYERRWVLRRW